MDEKLSGSRSWLYGRRDASFAAGFLTGGKNYVLAADLNQLKGSATKKNSACELEKTKIDTYTTLNVDLSSLNLQMVSSDDDSYYMISASRRRRG